MTDWGHVLPPNSSYVGDSLYRVTLRHVPSGREATSEPMKGIHWWKYNKQYDEITNDGYWWSEGNYSCDCNRSSMFVDAIGEDFDTSEYASECGDDLYLVVAITLVRDGQVVYSEVGDD